MKRFSAFFALLLFAFQVQAGNLQVYFSPKGGCTEAVVSALRTARTSVYVAAYSFTSVPIAKALVEAKKRGVLVVAILDSSNQTDKYSAATYLADAKIKTMIDGKHPIAHNKFMVIDAAIVLTGSFNFTKAAEEGNAENLLVISDPELAAKYTVNWNDHFAHSTPYTRRVPGR